MVLDDKTTAALKKEIKQKVKGTKPTPAGASVLYLGHIPHGFYEEEMRGFFAQFGTVSRVRLARNKKTGKSKHYAFIEFKQAEVGEIVAKAMDGYLLFSKVLVAKIVPPADVHPELFKGANRPFKVVDRVASLRKLHNKARTPEQAEKREKRLLEQEKRKRKRLAEAGIDYEFGGFEAAAALPKKRMRGVVSGAVAAPPAVAAAPPTATREPKAAPKRKQPEEPMVQPPKRAKPVAPDKDKAGGRPKASKASKEAAVSSSESAAVPISGSKGGKGSKSSKGSVAAQPSSATAKKRPKP